MTYKMLLFYQAEFRLQNTNEIVAYVNGTHDADMKNLSEYADVVSRIHADIWKKSGWDKNKGVMIVFTIWDQVLISV